MRNFLRFLFLLLPLTGWAVPQSGVWASGGIAPFTLFFAGDTATYRKIQIEKELVLVQLYPGFAVVKGTYWMRNTSQDTLRSKAGYPVDEYYEYKEPNFWGVLRVDFDTSYALKVVADGIICPVSVDSIEEPVAPDQYNYHIQKFWNTWENTFLPGSLVRVEIYALVSTNDSKMADDFSDMDDNVFVYLPYSGLWKSPPVERTILIQLMNDLKRENVRGISPDSLFLLDAGKKILYCHRTDVDLVRPIVIAYGKKLFSFGFPKIATQAASYFGAIDQLETLGPNQLSLADFDHGDPYSFGSDLVSPFLYPYLLILLIAGIIITIGLISARKFL